MNNDNRMKAIFLTAALAWVAWACVPAQTSGLIKQGSAVQLTVDGKPFLVLGGELGNSSATCAADIERIFPKLERMGLNTVLVPAYWDLTEPAEGEFDFSLTDKVIEQARTNGLRVVFLWFGAWKNSMSCYAPAWFKADYKRFPRAETAAGKPLEIASVFSEEVFRADNRAFTAWLNHLAAVDKGTGTVIMIQVENEIGMLEDARDHSPAADKAFLSAVPKTLIDYLKANKKTLHPEMKAKWEAQGCKTQGTWRELFGDDIYTDEIFMAWQYACYVERMAQTARGIYDVPLYVNAAMNSRGRKPGEYPSAGPLAHLIDVWHAGAPGIDVLAPDLYDSGFIDWVAKYHLPNNPLFIPEIQLSDNDGVRAFYVFAEHDAMGFSPFSIEDGSDDCNAPLVRGYAALKELMPLLTKYQGTGALHGLLFDGDNKERVITDGDLTVTCRHYFTLPWDARATDGSAWAEGGGLLLRLAKNDYILAGSGIVAEFAKTTEKDASGTAKALGEDGFVLADGEEEVASVGGGKFAGMRQGLASVEEVSVNGDGSFSRVRSLGGDQTHQGRHVRISVDDFKILHVKLYEYK